MRPLAATYRLQFTPTFTFADAALLAPSLAALGVSHVYASPVFEAVPGSLHGYDVIDPARVRAALGGPEGWRALAQTLHAHGLGIIADIVPNHLALAGNPWWHDLLQHGRRSRYADYFDVALPDDATLTVVIPLLADTYAVELEQGRLHLVHDAGHIRLAYGDDRLPLAPESLEPWLAQANGDADAVVARLNGDHEALHSLLEAQHYRLTWWRLARDETPYRRFFDVNTLVGLRMERPDVFRDVHELPLSWLRDGVVDGVRVDHVDGLADPAAYLRALRDAATDNVWIGVEKILATDEPLPPWPVHGTTGYEFGALVTRLFTAAEGEAPLTDLHQQVTGLTEPFDEVARAARHEMVSHWLLGDTEQAAALLYERCQASVAMRDYSQRECLTLVQEVVAQLPVYRTYVDRHGPSARDAALLGAIFAGVTQSQPDLPAPLVAFAAHLCLEPGDDTAVVARLQQLSTAVAAKAVEDTAFFRDTRYLAHNDVGGDPARFASPVAEFHDSVLRWQAEQPLGLRSTSTHDSKRSEDVRARLTVLSEAAPAWADAVAAWSSLADRHRHDGQPDHNLEYYLYQTLAGAWPLSRERAQAHAEKAAREAKVFTNWTSPAPAYEQAVRQFIDGLYDSRNFVAQMDAFVATLHPADWHKSLAQVLLKITVPGVPDLYQGAYGWLLHLSDPDNRVPVNHAALAAALEACATRSPAEIAAQMDTGLAKVWVTTRALHLRQRHEDLTPAAAYRPLGTSGGGGAHVAAFRRGDAVVVVVPIRTYRRDWRGTTVELPPGRWTDVLTDTTCDGGTRPVADLWATLPVALLERTSA